MFNESISALTLDSIEATSLFSGRFEQFCGIIAFLIACVREKPQTVAYSDDTAEIASTTSTKIECREVAQIRSMGLSFQLMVFENLRKT